MGDTLGFDARSHERGDDVDEDQHDQIHSEEILVACRQQGGRHSTVAQSPVVAEPVSP